MFEEKQKILKEVAKKLKNDFCGLDDIIDKIINTISSWYMLPNLQSRPLLINLWGLTGTGKTDLIRKLVLYLEYCDKYLEVNIPSQIQEFSYLYHMMTDSGITENSPGIILLDEFQGFRSKEESGKNISNQKQQDIWQLLSDGKISNKHDFLREVTQLYFEYKKRVERKNNPVKNNNKNKLNGLYGGHDDIPDFYTLDKLKQLLGLTESIKELILLDDEKILDLLDHAYFNSSKYIREANYSQCLIFVCGNLDDAYTISDAITEVDVDPDIFYEMTKDINILDIKRCLSDLFKPEQIARLGNIHIIYPSFNKETYENIIKQKLNNLLTNINNQLNINMKFDKSVIDFIFKNGVYPAQGTRPVYSTIAYCIEAYIPKIILQNYNKHNITIKVTEKNQKYYINNIEIPSDIQNIRNKINIEEIKKVAVHEAGHIMGHVYIANIIPKIATAKAISSNTAGYVLAQNNNYKVKSYDDLLNDICIHLSGYCAEKYIYKKNITSGSENDLGNATKIALKIIQKYGMSHIHIGWVSHPNILNSDICNKESYQLTDQIIDINHILENCEKKIRNTIKENEMEFKKLIQLLIKKDILTQIDIKNIVGERDIKNNNILDEYLNS